MKRILTTILLVILCGVGIGVSDVDAQFKRKAKTPSLQEQFDAAHKQGPEAVQELMNQASDRNDRRAKKQIEEMKQSAKEQDFADEYTRMEQIGGPAFDDYKRRIRNKGQDKKSKEEKEFLKNLEEGKRPDGGRKTNKDRQREEQVRNPEPQGYQGDKTDPGPSDWSDYIIETDAQGNVTGFKPRDYYERDTDGDGKVSEEEQQEWDKAEEFKNMDRNGDGNVDINELRDAEKDMDANEDGEISEEEREWWNDKEKAAREDREATEENGGPPGEVPPIAEWDRDQDGEPDPDFILDCWTCKMPKTVEPNECHYGTPGECDAHSCLDANDEVCVQANEMHDGVEYKCYNCEQKKKTEDPNFCEDNGYTSDPACDGECNGDMCLAIDVDKTHGMPVPEDKSRLRDSTVRCYRCTTIDEEPCARMEAKSGGCPGTCSSANEACYPFTHEGAQCHRCEPLTDDETCEKAGMIPGECPGTCADGQACAMQRKGGVLCHTCQSGAVGPDPCENVTCASETDCKKEECVAGKCVPTLKTGACDDGDACTENDECSDGECKGTDVAIPSAEECKEFECDSAKGIIDKFLDGKACDDSDACTSDDQCAQGVCKGAAISLTSNTQCVTYSCDAASGEVSSITTGATCDDGDACTSNDQCNDQGGCTGTPIVCNDENPCTDDQCSAGECQYTNNESTCDDNDACTSADQCRSGECVGESVEVPTDTQCMTYTCDASAGIKEEARTDQACDDGDVCTGQDKCNAQGACVGRPITDCAQTCAEANLKTGACPGTCNETTHTCTPIDPVPGLKCHACNPIGISDCYSNGMQDGTCPTPDPCAVDGQVCYSARMDDGQACWSCEEDRDWEPDCEAPYSPGQCSGDNGGCPSDTRCRAKDGGCQYCQPMTGIQQEPCPDAHVGLCHGNCRDDQDCYDYMSTGPFETMCHTCTDKADTAPPQSCPPNSWVGTCERNGGCAERTQCRVKRAYQDYKCIWCQPMTGGSEPDDLVSLPGTPMGGLQTDPVSIGEPVDDGFISLGNGLVIGGDTSELVIDIEYFILVVETPRGRYVLNKKGTMDLGDFKASQVMQLVKADSAKQAVQSLGSMFPQGGMNIASFLSGGGIGLGDMQNLLKKGMEKGRRYGDNCFEKEDNFAETEMPDAVEPPPSKKKKKESSESTTPKKFGKSTAKEVPADGPMIACGEKDGRKALAIMDARGRIVDYIFRDVKDGDPNAIQNALVKAQRMTDLVQDVTSGNWKGILNRVKDRVINKVQSRVETSVKEIFAPDDEEVMIEPNDPFYRPPAKGKKKGKLFGILGSTKKAAKVTIGSTMKMGGKGTTLGATEGNYDSKKKEMKWQWGIHRVGYTPLEDPDSAWHLVNADQRNVVVAVIDSGLDMNHVDGPQYVWENSGETPGNGVDDDNNGYIDDVHGWNFLDDNSDLTDEQGHGSFVAGIIAAKRNNNIGMAGINPGAVIMPIKVADKEGQTNSFMITRAIYYAVDNGADIINISLGARVPSRMEELAFRYAYKNGVFIAAAAGNVGEDIQEHGPASVRGAFAVGAMDIEETRSTISNWGANNGLLAPGDRIISLIAEGTGKKLKPSTRKAGYYPQSGTSFSTPIVAATASLLLVQNPDLTNLDIEDILHRTADDMDEPGWDEYTGAGVLNAKAALSADVNNRVTAKITGLEFKEVERGRAVNVFATVRGDFDHFVVEVGKGERAKKFKQVAGPFTEQANFDLITQLTRKDHLRGSKTWVLRIVVTHHDGTQSIARTLLNMK